MNIFHPHIFLFLLATILPSCTSQMGWDGLLKCCARHKVIEESVSQSNIQKTHGAFFLFLLILSVFHLCEIKRKAFVENGGVLFRCFYLSGHHAELIWLLLLVYLFPLNLCWAWFPDCTNASTVPLPVCPSAKLCLELCLEAPGLQL